VLKINQAYRICGQDKGDDIVRNYEDFEHHVFSEGSEKLPELLFRVIVMYWYNRITLLE
jgi:hypothetical protein